MTIPPGSPSGGKEPTSDIASLGAAELERRRQQRGSMEDSPTAAVTPAPASAPGGSPRARVRAPIERFAANLQINPRKDETGEYIRLIRDGYADRVEAMIREAGRDIEVGKKTDRYSRAAWDIVTEFETRAKEFSSKTCNDIVFSITPTAEQKHYRDADAIKRYNGLGVAPNDHAYLVWQTNHWEYYFAATLPSGGTIYYVSQICETSP